MGNGDDLHVLMRMGSEAFSRSYPVVVQNAQGAEIHAAGVVILVKTEMYGGCRASHTKSVHGFRLCLLHFFIICLFSDLSVCNKQVALKV